MSQSVPHKLWQTVLDGEPRERAQAVLQEIVAALPDASSDEVRDASLAGGASGLAVLCAYLARAGYDDGENASLFLERAMRAVSDEPMTGALYGGFTGVAWAVEHLSEQLLDADEDYNEAVDEALLESLRRQPWEDDYDLVSGLVGLGVYALERLPRATARECLKLIVVRLEETAESLPGGGVTWPTPPHLLPSTQRELCPDGYYNLGVAHGVPGVVALLGGACAAGVERERAARLLDGAVRWLLEQKLEGGALSCFPNWVAGGFEPEESRLAWCYGDAGVAATLLLAARAVGEAAWESEALNIARRASARTVADGRVRDAGLCHGAAGLGHVFNRMWQATGEAFLRDAARFWLGQALEMRRPGEGVAGYSALTSPADGVERWEAEPGLLTGAAGIALALLAATTDIEPAWDRMLLVSLPGV